MTTIDDVLKRKEYGPCQGIVTKATRKSPDAKFGGRWVVKMQNVVGGTYWSTPFKTRREAAAWLIAEEERLLKTFGPQKLQVKA